jgi:hypothetical protein
MRTPMAITVIGGLLTSTLLTLVVVPVIYSLLDRRPDVRASTSPSPTPGPNRGEAARPIQADRLQAG